MFLLSLVAVSVIHEIYVAVFVLLAREKDVPLGSHGDKDENFDHN